jgi:heme/copper-type cytochrome/quinol oxidase subunit 3
MVRLLVSSAKVITLEKMMLGEKWNGVAVHTMNQGNRATAARRLLGTMAAGATFVGLHL